MTPLIGLTWLDVLLAAGLLAAAVVASLVVRLGVAGELLVGVLRAIAQLGALGLVLHAVFSWDIGLVVLLLLVAMVLAAAWMAFRRVSGELPGLFVPTLIALGLGPLATCAVVFYGVVGVDPWYDPRYVVPLFGLLLGAAMSGVAVGLRHFGQEMRRQREAIELLLSLGATRFQAVREPLRQSLRAALGPTVTGLMAMGVVFVPGMMSGQLLAGVEPLLAVRYQLLLLLMLALCVGLSSFLALLLVAQRCFTAAHQLRI